MLIDVFYDQQLHGEIKLRTYRESARKLYHRTAQEKIKSRRKIRSATGKQLRFSWRNIKTINRLPYSFKQIPLKSTE